MCVRVCVCFKPSIFIYLLAFTFLLPCVQKKRCLQSTHVYALVYDTVKVICNSYVKSAESRCVKLRTAKLLTL